MPPRNRATDGRWSASHDRCRQCGTTEIRHAGKGYCARCRYHATKEEKWPVGLRVWVAWDGAWRTGLIESRPSRVLASVRIESGELVRVGFTRGHIFATDPGQRPVPASKVPSPRAGQGVMFRRDSSGRIVGRAEGVWSSRAPACVDCGTTERPHESRGRCHRCYMKWRLATNHNGYAERARRRSKEYRLATDYDAKRDAVGRAQDPAYREQHRAAANRWYQRHVAKWKHGAQVRTSIANVDLDGPKGEPRVTRRKGQGAPYLTGVIEDTNNGSAYVRFTGFALWIPFARLEVVPDADRREA
jgi:hypothetical protein